MLNNKPVRALFRTAYGPHGRRSRGGRVVCAAVCDCFAVSCILVNDSSSASVLPYMPIQKGGWFTYSSAQENKQEKRRTLTDSPARAFASSRSSAQFAPHIPSSPRIASMVSLRFLVCSSSVTLPPRLGYQGKLYKTISHQTPNPPPRL